MSKKIIKLTALWSLSNLIVSVALANPTNAPLLGSNSAGNLQTVNLSSPLLISSGSLGLSYTPVNKAGDTITGSLNIGNVIGFSGYNSQIGPGITSGYYLDSANLALRAPTSTGLEYFQNASGNQTYAVFGPSTATFNTAISYTSPSTLFHNPLSNTTGTYSSQVVNGVTNSAYYREFLQSIEYKINTGAAANNNSNPAYSNNKVASYWGIEVDPGAGAAWGQNTEYVVTAGSFSNGFNFGLGNEIDIENNDVDAPANLGAQTGPTLAGLSIGTGASSHKITAGIIVNTVQASNQNFRSGFLAIGGISDQTIWDLGSASYSYLDTGSHASALKLSGVYSGPAISIGSSSGLAEDANHNLLFTSPNFLRYYAGANLDLFIGGASGTMTITTANDTNSANTPMAFNASSYNFLTGTINAPAYQAAGAAGVSCAAGTINLATLTVVKGIVTHC